MEILPDYGFAKAHIHEGQYLRSSSGIQHIEHVTAEVLVQHMLNTTALLHHLVIAVFLKS